MHERRIPRRRGLDSAEALRAESIEQKRVKLTDANVLARLLERSKQPGFKNCNGVLHMCGTEAACHDLTDEISMCVCPHDLSPPTKDLKCPNRLYFPVTPKPVQRTGTRNITPKPIRNIMPPNGNATNVTTALPDAEQVARSHQKISETAGIAIAFIAVFAIVGAAGFYLWRRKCYTKKTQHPTPDISPMNLKKGLLLANKYTPNPQYFACTPPDVPILVRENFVFLHDIGEGCFGKVFKGEFHRGETMEIVAVKVLKDSATRENEEDFMREVEIMSTFRHENILSLIGVVLRDSGNSPWMVFEYMPYGDLAQVLRANTRQLRTPTPGLQPLTKNSLYWITMQIASGMAYLSAQRFVHRDLACRNCLVGSDLVVKIADFGMSRDVYTCDYYKIGGSRLLPVRWMSPESVLYGRFTLESDVWSFGVVLWEVYSYGKQPYYGHNNEEVVKLILQGIMLIPPEDCPPFICQIMRECWKSEPRDRLRFSEILEILEKNQEKQSLKGTLPRPPQGPVTIRSPDVLDSEGYLLPAPTVPCEYLQTLAD